MARASGKLASELEALDRQLGELKSSFDVSDPDVGEIEERIHAMRRTLDRIGEDARNRERRKSDTTTTAGAIADALNESLGAERYASAENVRDLAKGWDVDEAEPLENEALRLVHRSHHIEFAVMLANDGQYRIEARVRR